MLFMVLQSHVYAQDNNKKEDLLIQTADSLYNQAEYEQAISKYREYIDSQGKPDEGQKKDLADLHGTIAFCYFRLDKYHDAIDWYGKALELRRELGNLEDVANTINNIGLCYKQLGNYDKAIEYYTQTLKIDEELGQGNEIAKTINNIGMVYKSWGRYDKALEHFERSLSIKKGLNDQVGVAKSLNNIGLLYFDWKKYDQALLSFKESIEIDRSLNNVEDLGTRLNNVGKAYFLMNEFDSALFYFERSLEIHQEARDQDQIALEYNNIGKVHQARKQYRDAINYFSSALDIYSKLGMESEKATVLANLSNAYRTVGQNEKSLQMLDSSTAIAIKINLRNQLKQNYEYYSTIYSDRQDYKKSLEYFKKYTDLKDSMFTSETSRQLADFQIKYEKEKDQARILSLEKENLSKTVQRNAYMFTGLAVVFIASFIILYLRQRAVHVKIITEEKIRRLEEEKKLMGAKLLVEGQEEERKRIATELHDGLGVLLSATKMQFSVIRDKNTENREIIDKAYKMLEQASGDVRKISHNMMPGLLTKLGFYEAVQDLFEKIDDSGKLHAVCAIRGNEERLPENKEIMLYRIVQEMVNNTLKHAEANNIELKVTADEEKLDVLYADDGKGFDVKEKLGTESIGLKSIQSRVDFLNGRLQVDSNPGKGVRYSLQIPVN